MTVIPSFISVRVDDGVMGNVTLENACTFHLPTILVAPAPSTLCSGGIHSPSLSRTSTYLWYSIHAPHSVASIWHFIDSPRLLMADSHCTTPTYVVILHIRPFAHNVVWKALISISIFFTHNYGIPTMRNTSLLSSLSSYTTGMRFGTVRDLLFRLRACLQAYRHGSVHRATKRMACAPFAYLRWRHCRYGSADALPLYSHPLSIVTDAPEYHTGKNTPYGVLYCPCIPYVDDQTLILPDT